jgi:hypothetical protein
MTVLQNQNGSIKVFLFSSGDYFVTPRAQGFALLVMSVC